MDESDISQVKGKVQMQELRLKALINILSKEGVVTTDEVEDELKNLLEDDE